MSDSVQFSLPCSLVHGLSQARILEWIAMPSSRGNFLTQGLNLHLISPALAGMFFTASATQMQKPPTSYWNAVLAL